MQKFRPDSVNKLCLTLLSLTLLTQTVFGAGNNGASNTRNYANQGSSSSILNMNSSLCKR